MSLSRKLEVISGVMTALLGVAAGAQMLTMNVATAQRLERNFSLVREFLAALVLYAMPGLLIVIGSYVHASRLRSWGLPLVLISSSCSLLVFVLLFINLAFYTASRMFWLSFSFAVLATITMLLSLIVRVRDT
jgi:hypothetical protein